MTLGLEGLLDELAERIAAAVVARLEPNGGSRPPAEPDHLLTLTQAAERLGVKPAWLRRHAGTLPFVRRLGHKTVRYSSAAITRWLAGARTGSQVLRGPENPRPTSTIQRRGPIRDPRKARS